MTEKNEIATTTSIQIPSDPSETLTNLDKYIEDDQQTKTVLHLSLLPRI